MWSSKQRVEEVKGRVELGGEKREEQRGRKGEEGYGEEGDGETRRRENWGGGLWGDGEEGYGPGR